MPNPDTLPQGAEQEARRLATDAVETWASGPCDSTEELVASTERAILAGMRWAMHQQAGGDGWQPIETAPRDRTTIDLWRDGERWTDCFWGFPDHCCGEYGRYCDSEWHSLEEGWVWSTMNETLPASDPTHWRPLPEPPSDRARIRQAEGGDQ